MFKDTYRAVMRQYEADRDRAAALLQSRRDEAYARLPRLRALDARLSAVGLEAAKCALTQDAASLASLRAEMDQMRTERHELLRAAGYAADYLTVAYRCPICQDTGRVTLPGGAAAERCVCLKRRLVEAYYGLSNVKHALDAENFDTFDLRYYSQTVNPDEGLSPHANMQTVYRTALQFTRDFEKTFENLLLYGDTGLGKTFLCHCIARDLLDAGHSVLYLTAPRLFRTVEDYRFNLQQMEDPENLREMLDAFTEAEVLIIDDLGAEFSTVATSAALYDIINERLINRKPCVVSTNLSQPGLMAQYSERIVSRFLGHYKMLKFFGDDIRVKKKYGSF